MRTMIAAALAGFFAIGAAGSAYACADAAKMVQTPKPTTTAQDAPITPTPKTGG